ncbi:hypothetical protein [Pseudomonas alkylphenolica]|uniref:hypothetical protein n=1 Tax=Pseudomonas alkylphenolica TaxID=237609 RepID=UPI0018D8B7F0|nr:hypothetical protein [Pseudomonas alkylphenolica]MBH3430224.1 hypothetical protein [Pseudomonas alkylphenolica]
MCNDQEDGHTGDSAPTQVETEDEVEYSEEFAAMILEQEAEGCFQEIDVDEMLALLDRMIIEAQNIGQKLH